MRDLILVCPDDLIARGDVDQGIRSEFGLGEGFPVGLMLINQLNGSWTSPLDASESD